MKFRSTIILFLGLFPLLSFAQIVKLEPAQATASQKVRVIFDASQGTGGLKGAEQVYMHSGVITSSPSGTNWTNVVGNWGQDDGLGKMTKVEGEDNLWFIDLEPSVNDYYNISEGTTVFRVAMVFRNASGSKEGKGNPGDFQGGSVGSNGDIYVDLATGNFLIQELPTSNLVFVKSRDSTSVRVSASSTADSLILNVFINDSTLSQKAFNKDNIELTLRPSQNTSLSFNCTGYWDGDSVSIHDSFDLVVRPANILASVPTELKRGVNYHEDKSKATLVFEAPLKEFVYVVGDFNDWEVRSEYLMNYDPEKDLFWLELTGLEASTPYVFQYWVDGKIKVGDPYSDQVADPWNDKFIPQSVFPNLPGYSLTENEIATVLQTGQEAFIWAESEKNRPQVDEDNLIIYELLVRDFIGSHNYKDLADTLSYLKRLGVNTIELMPIMEFEGNESWGYNPSYFFAPDKYYGTKNDLKAFIQKAHQEGFLVLLDMVLNHAFGQNPWVRMYWDAENNRPAENNPWFNPIAKHPFNVGYDFNHESLYTQAFVDSVNAYWLQEYHFDGYRFDLSKGFTQNFTDDVSEWSQRDNDRIALLKRMNSKIKEVKPDAIVILEHFGNSSEENELKSDGMMVWGNNNYDYSDLLQGKTSVRIQSASESKRISYMESHDEERLAVRAIASTAGTTLKSVADTLVFLNRIKLLTAFFYTLPGPKLMWQFQELGYDKSINFNGRVGNKPLPWGTAGLGLYEDNERQKLYKTHAAIINLVNQHRDVFKRENYRGRLSGSIKQISYAGDEFDVFIYGNFGLKDQSSSVNFPSTGVWYNYFGNDSLVLDNTSVELQIPAGNFRIYTTKKFQVEDGLVNDLLPIVTTEPENFSINDEVKLTFHADRALNATPFSIVSQDSIYLHGGVVTTGRTSTNLNYQVNGGNQAQLSPSTDANKWKITLTPADFFQIDPADNAFRLGMTFHNSQSTSIGTGYNEGNIFLNLQLEGQIVRVVPDTFQKDTPIRIIFDAAIADAAGTAGLQGAEKVYMHSGIITDGPTSTSWQYVVGNWGQDDGIGQMQKVAGSDTKWEISFTAQSYYTRVPASAKWERIGMVFRNADGTREGKGTGGSDIFVNFTEKVFTGVLAFEDEDLDVSIFPNPNSGRVQFDRVRAFEQIRVLNIRGQEVFQVQDFEGTEFLLPTHVVGLHFIQLKMKNKYITKRLIIR